MEKPTLITLLTELVYEINVLQNSMNELRQNTISIQEYEMLQKQMEILSIQVAKNSRMKQTHFIIVPPKSPHSIKSI